VRRLLVVGAVLFGVLANTSAVAAYGGPQTSSSVCSGKVVINVTEKVVNDADSGENGNYWALDAYGRNIQVRETGPNSYCATVDYQGQFVTFAAESPGVALHANPAGIKGTYSGGYRATFTGELLASPAWQTNGNVGTVDYGCNEAGLCTGIVSWLHQYFTVASGADFDQTWWGWQYKAGKAGTWTNSSDGNSGDIAG